MQGTRLGFVGAAILLALHGCAEQSAGPSFPDAEIAEAYGMLRDAETFASTCVGFASAMPPEIPGWRAIVSHPHAAEHFAALLRTARGPGQMYALAGLYVADRARFDERVPAYLRSDERVPVMSGCVGSVTEVRSIAGKIQSGEISDELLCLECPQ